MIVEYAQNRYNRKRKKAYNLFYEIPIKCRFMEHNNCRIHIKHTCQKRAYEFGKGSNRYASSWNTIIVKFAQNGHAEKPNELSSKIFIYF